MRSNLKVIEQNRIIGGWIIVLIWFSFHYCHIQHFPTTTIVTVTPLMHPVNTLITTNLSCITPAFYQTHCTLQPFTKQYFLLLSPVSLLFSSLSLYLKDDSTADHSGGDVLLFIGHPLDLPKLTVQLSVYVGEHWPHRAAGYVEDILTADDQESQQNEAEEELCHQGPHRPTLIPSKSTQPNSTTHSLSLQWLLLPHTPLS